EPGVGSTFTLYVPVNYVAPDTQNPRAAQAPTPVQPHIETKPKTGEAPVLHRDQQAADVIVEEQLPDDRNEISEGDRTVLIVEDDVRFARILLDMARDKGLKGNVATRGESALHLATRYRPHAITPDIQLPHPERWTVPQRPNHAPA